MFSAQQIAMDLRLLRLLRQTYFLVSGVRGAGTNDNGWVRSRAQAPKISRGVARHKAVSGSRPGYIYIYIYRYRYIDEHRTPPDIYIYIYMRNSKIAQPRITWERHRNIIAREKTGAHYTTGATPATLACHLIEYHRQASRRCSWPSRADGVADNTDAFR